MFSIYKGDQVKSNPLFSLIIFVNSNISNLRIFNDLAIKVTCMAIIIFGWDVSMLQLSDKLVPLERTFQTKEMKIAGWSSNLLENASGEVMNL